MKFALLIIAFCSRDVILAQNVSKYWILFKDKPSLSTHPIVTLSKSALQRRSRQGTARLTDDLDIPVSSGYIQQLRQIGIRIDNSSRWLNAVTAFLSAAELDKVTKLSFVKSVRPVIFGRRDRFHTSGPSRNLSTPTVLDYGPSARQNAFINVPPVHALGYTGKGVRVGVIDTGFDLDHPVFSSISVVADSDFVDKDGDVSECLSGQKNCGSHGTSVLSALAGHLEGSLIGPAFGADFLLARTEEDDGFDQKTEEDNWVAALEWLEQNGAEIVTSSVSFFDEFSTPGANYTLSDLDGHTALTTIATNIAFDKGVLVFNSAGNMGDRGKGYLGTPSDGKKMIAVGATYGDSTAADFSSRGPTEDGRIKPDVAALGVQVRVASGTAAYDNLGGTSLSTPLVAGIAALALEANTSWSARRLYDAIRRSGHLAGHPDPTIGFGIPNALRAVYDDPNVPASSPVLNLTSFPNPANPMVQIRFTAVQAGVYSLTIYNTLGQRVRTIRRGSPIVRNEQVTVVWDGINDTGNRASSGVYLYRVDMNGRSMTKKLILLY